MLVDLLGWKQTHEDIRIEKIPIRIDCADKPILGGLSARCVASSATMGNGVSLPMPSRDEGGHSAFLFFRGFGVRGKGGTIATCVIRPSKMSASTLLRRLAASPSARAAASATAATVVATIWLDGEEQNFGAVTSCEQSTKTSTSTSRGPKLLFLGSGSSTGCPKPLCALAFPDKSANANGSDEDGGLGYSCSCRDTGGGGGSSSLAANNDDDPALAALQEQLGNTCRTSKLAAIGDPRNNKNYRNNPSLLISHQNNDDDQAFGTFGEEPTPIRNVIIDCGKTFRETAIRWMPPNGIRSLDAIVLTHEHMDAVAGLDDVRGFQRRTAAGVMESTPVFLSMQTFEAIRKQFFYLVPKGDPFQAHDGRVVQGDGKVKVVRAVASLQYRLIEQFKPFVAAGLKMVPLPVMHGEDLVCLGFAFTVNGNKDDNKEKKSSGGLNVVYLSDISRMLPTTEAYIMQQLPETDILILDSLLVDREHPVHYSLKQAIELARRLKAKKVYIVGINCDDFLPHDEANEELKKVEGLDVELAYDGLVIEA